MVVARWSSPWSHRRWEDVVAGKGLEQHRRMGFWGPSCPSGLCGILKETETSPRAPRSRGRSSWRNPHQGHIFHRTPCELCVTHIIVVICKLNKTLALTNAALPPPLGGPPMCFSKKPKNAMEYLLGFNQMSYGHDSTCLYATP